jgi:hypothetical protein
MIITSGFYTNPNRTGCDEPKLGGQHALLLGQENRELNAVYHGVLLNISEYRVPGDITSVIGGRWVSRLSPPCHVKH